MMELHENIDEALLLLYFSGTLGEKEKEEVENNSRHCDISQTTYQEPDKVVGHYA